MRDCHDIRREILKTGAPDRRRVSRHLATCPGCSEWLAGLQVADRAVQLLEERSVPSGFEATLENALAREIASTPERSPAWGWLRWRLVAPALAAAAAVVLVVMSMGAPSIETPKPAQAALVQEVGIDLTLAVTSPVALTNVDVALTLPPGVDLAGARRSEVGRNLAWREDLPAGRTTLALGLVAFAEGRHRVALTVCEDGDCVARELEITSAPNGVQVTWMVPETRGWPRFALEAGAPSRHDGSTMQSGSITKEDRS